MRLKKGVRIRGLRPEIVLAMIMANEVCEKLGVEMVITSCTEGKHSWGSLHYSGCAFDFRKWVFSDNGVEARKMLSEKLGQEFDVVLERTHIHVEFQPKEA